MTVVQNPISIVRYIGHSTDDKPTIAAPLGMTPPTIGSTFYEYDTFALKITYDGTTWVLKDQTGEVQDSPTSYTVLDRLKAIETALGTLYTGPADTAFYWTPLIYGPETIYEGAGKIYFVIFVAKSGSQRAMIHDSTDSSNKILEPWATQYTPCVVMPLFGAPIPFSTALRVDWMSGTETHLALKIGYTKD